MKTMKKLSALILSGALLLSGALCVKADKPALPFDDLVPDAWYTSGIEYVYENGIMSGMGNDKFVPADNLTREQLMQVFFNLSAPVRNAYLGNTGFKDVGINKWYSPAVTWAKEEGITSGVNENVFGLGQNVTREQLATFIKNYVVYAGCEISIEAILDSFEDSDKVSDWAVDGMKFCVSNGIIQGKTETTLDPKGYATRAELAQMLSQFLEAGFIYRVNFDANGADSCSSNFKYIASGSAIGNLPYAEKEGFRNGGWWYNGELLTNTTVMNISEHITVIKQWDNGYKVYFEADGGECSEKYRLVKDGDAIGNLPVPTKDGFTFEGWLYEYGEESYMVSADTILDTAVDCFLTAQWKPIDNAE